MLVADGRPSPDASPAAEGGEEIAEGLPAFGYQAHFAGGAMGAPGMPGQAVIDLTEGEWVRWSEDPACSKGRTH